MIRSTDGFIFGGFADKPWTSSNKYCEFDKAFLFSLNSPSNEFGPTKIRTKQNVCSNAMYHISSYDPRFGGGLSELHIDSDANNKIYSNSNLGITYEIPPVKTYTFWVGSNYFKVSEIEVFQII